MRDENNFIFLEKFLLNYADSLKLLRALENTKEQSYSIQGQISYHHFFLVIFSPPKFQKSCSYFYMRDENNFMFSEKFLLNYVDSLKLLRALGDKHMRSYSIQGQISYHCVIFSHLNFRKAARIFICGTRIILCFQKSFFLTMRTV